MITHIIYGSDLPKSSIDRIKKLIEQEKGLLRFRFHAVEDWHLEQGDLLAFETLFENGQRFRRSKRIPEKEFVITITDRPNAQNFYASLDPEDPYTGFVHSGEWEHYIQCERELPVAFTIVNLLIAFYTCPSYDQVHNYLHQRPIGCANDFCFNKREVIFKLRTGDVCTDCIRAMQGNGWSDLVIDHAMRIISALSGDMRYNRFFQPVMEPSNIRFDMETGIVTLPAYQHLKIDLDPQDVVFYLFFLRYSEDDGLHMSVFNTDQWAKDAFALIYQRLWTHREVNDFGPVIARLADPQSNRRSECKSRINKALTDVLGSRLAKPYLIEGEPKKPFKVALPLTKVEVVNYRGWMDLPARP
jgi:hypothetical protein